MCCIFYSFCWSYIYKKVVHISVLDLKGTDITPIDISVRHKRNLGLSNKSLHELLDIPYALHIYL